MTSLSSRVIAYRSCSLPTCIALLTVLLCNELLN